MAKERHVGVIKEVRHNPMQKQLYGILRRADKAGDIAFIADLELEPEIRPGVRVEIEYLKPKKRKTTARRAWGRDPGAKIIKVLK